VIQRRLLQAFLIVLMLMSAQPCRSDAAGKGGRIVILPLDGRNQPYEYVRRLISICGYEPLMPPREFMGNIGSFETSFKKQWNRWIWLRETLDDDCRLLIVSADSFIYGGLLESRNSPADRERALYYTGLLEEIKKAHRSLRIMVFSSIPRKEARDRERNLAVNMRLLELTEQGVVDFLLISGDDMTDIPTQVKEIALLRERAEALHTANRVLISHEDRMRVGIDDAAMVLFTRYMSSLRREKLKVYVEYRDIASARREVEYYSATTVMSLAVDMAEAIGVTVKYRQDEADLVLAVNHSSEEKTIEDFASRVVALQKLRPVTVVDLCEAPERITFFRELYRKGIYEKLAGYASWGMGTNSLGTAICEGCAYVRLPDGNARQEHLAFLYERMLADYAYLDIAYPAIVNETAIPAYSLAWMDETQNRQALDIAYMKMVEALQGVGMRCSLEKGQLQSQLPEALKKSYIPLDPRDDATFAGDRLIRFDVPSREPGPASRIEIVAGPIFFPFHRLFEIWIPTKALPH
jgi:hypothetical protein